VEGKGGQWEELEEAGKVEAWRVEGGTKGGMREKYEGWVYDTYSRFRVVCLSSWFCAGKKTRRQRKRN
jgi:hypothetical protein